MKQFSSTQVVIKFTTDNDKALLSLLFMFWFVQKVIQRIDYEIQMIVNDFSEALSFAGKVFVIGYTSIIWGIL